MLFDGQFRRGPPRRGAPSTLRAQQAFAQENRRYAHGDEDVLQRSSRRKRAALL
jgi:hypothetical protein